MQNTSYKCLIQNKQQQNRSLTKNPSFTIINPQLNQSTHHQNKKPSKYNKTQTNTIADKYNNRCRMRVNLEMIRFKAFPVRTSISPNRSSTVILSEKKPKPCIRRKLSLRYPLLSKLRIRSIRSGLILPPGMAFVI